METASRQQTWPAVAAAVLVGTAAGVGGVLKAHHVPLAMNAPPFFGYWDVRLAPTALLPVAVAVLAWRVAPAVQRLPWGRLLGATYLLGLAWAVSLALTDGLAGLRRPLTVKGEYLGEVGRVPWDLTGFTSRIVTGTDRWATHVAGHPPGFVLLLKGLDAVGLSGPWPAAALCVLAGTSAAVAVLVTVRALVDERTARLAAPFLALVPAAVWIAVSADAFYLAVTAWGVALLALSRRCTPLALAGGSLVGASLFLTYGALPLGLLVLAVTARVRGLVVAAVGVALVVLAFALDGFWWFDGLHQTFIRVHAGAGGSRPYLYFLFADLAALAVAVGPATAVGLRALRGGDRLLVLVVPVAAGLLVADLSGTTRGEVERIWLLFVPWLVVATARLEHPRRWLAAQLVTGLVVQLGLRSAW